MEISEKVDEIGKMIFFKVILFLLLLSNFPARKNIE